MKKKIPGTSDAWLTICLSHLPSNPAYYIVSWRILGQFQQELSKCEQQNEMSVSWVHCASHKHRQIWPLNNAWVDKFSDHYKVAWLLELLLEQLCWKPRYEHFVNLNCIHIFLPNYLKFNVIYKVLLDYNYTYWPYYMYYLQNFL